MQDAHAVREHRPILVLSFLSLVLLVVVNSGTAVSMLISLLLRPFMHGVSLVKIDFLLLFFFLAAMSTVFGRGIRLPRTLNRLYWTTLISAGVGSVLGMVTFLSLARRLHLPLGKYAYFFADSYNSINQFAHLHVTKTGLYHLVSALGFEGIADRADTGRPFIEYLPPVVPILILATAAICLVTLLWGAGTVVRSWRVSRRWVALAAYSLAGSHLVKCLLDGGPLAYDFLPSVVMIGLMFLHARGVDFWSLLKTHGFRILLVTILFLSVIFVFSPDVALVVQPQQYAFFFGTYFVLAAVLVYERSRRLVLALTAVPALIWCSVFYYGHTVPDIAALSQAVTAQDRVFVCEPGGRQSGPEAKRVSEVTSRVLGQPLYRAYALERDNPLRNRRVLVTTNQPSSYPGFIFALRILKADSLLTLGSADGMTIRGMTTAGAASDSLLVFRVDFDPLRFPSLWKESSNIIDENNRFAVLYYLNDYFTARGLRDYVLIPMYYEEAT